MSQSAVLQWSDTGFVPTRLDDFVGAAVIAADSWLVDNGSVLALDVHRERFVSAVGSSADVDEFWVAATREVPSTGAWFPRVDLVRGFDGTETFRLQVRPAPQRALSVRLATAQVDPRTSPRVKGPDLERLGALRATARRAGADEAVVVDSAGFVAEGAYSSIVWWRGSTLCVVADEVPRLAGVTERALVTLATALGTPVEREIVAPDDLDSLEVWVLDSLNGIRIATQWLDGPALAEEPGRLRLWRTRLAALSRPASAAR